MIKIIVKKHFRQVLLINTLFKVSSSFLTILIAISISRTLSSIEAGNKSSGILYVIIFLSLSLFQLLLNFIISNVLALKRAKALQKFNEKIYYSILRTKEIREKNHKTSDFLVLLNKDVNQIVNYYTDTLPALIQACIGLIIYSLYIIVFLRSWIALVFMLILGSLQFLPPFMFKKYFIKNYRLTSESSAQFEQHLISGINGFATIKLLNIHPWFMEQYKIKQINYQKKGIIASGTAAIQNSMSNMISSLLEVGFVYILGILLLSNKLIFDVAIQIFTLSNNMYSYLKTIFSIQTDYHVREEAIRRINDHIQIVDKIEETYSALNTYNNTLEIKDLTLLQNDKYIFRNATLKLKDNGIWIIRGANGIGKSTFFHILLGQILPNKGEILFNGEIIQENQFSKCFSYCPQIPLDMDMSAEELFKLIPNQLEAIQAYLKYFNICSTLIKKKLNTLSGGERKKIMLSICLASDNPVILLDEPEASLDKEALDKLIESLSSIKKIVLVNSHVDSLVGKCTGIIHIKEHSFVTDKSFCSE